MANTDEDRKNWKRRLTDGARKAYHWGDNHIPPGLRLVLGIVLMIGGAFGFLPVLGFWMLPLGAVLVALDIPPLRRRLHRRLHPDGDDAARSDD